MLQMGLKIKNAEQNGYFIYKFSTKKIKENLNLCKFT